MEKRRWIPIYRHTAYAVSEDSVARKQFPLVLAWALTHWKAQGMTLSQARVSLGRRAAGMTGIGYVAIIRVKRVRYLLFEMIFLRGNLFKRHDTQKLFEQGDVSI